MRLKVTYNRPGGVFDDVTIDVDGQAPVASVAQAIVTIDRVSSGSNCLAMSGASARIGVIGRDELACIGHVTGLLAAGLKVVRASSAAMAEEWSETCWADLDVALLSLTADNTHWDRFRVVRVARQAHHCHPHLRLLGLCGPEVGPLVHRRLVAAGFERLWPANRVCSVDELARFISAGAHAGDRFCEVGLRVRGADVGQKTDPSAVLDYVAGLGLTEAFDRAHPQVGSGLSRRQIIRLRRHIAELGDLSMPARYTTGGPAGDRSLPSWRSCVDYVNQARGSSSNISSAHEPLTDTFRPRGFCPSS